MGHLECKPPRKTSCTCSGHPSPVTLREAKLEAKMSVEFEENFEANKRPKKVPKKGQKKAQKRPKQGHVENKTRPNWRPDWRPSFPRQISPTYQVCQFRQPRRVQQLAWSVKCFKWFSTGQWQWKARSTKFKVCLSSRQGSAPYVPSSGRMPNRNEKHVDNTRPSAQNTSQPFLETHQNSRA